MTTIAPERTADREWEALLAEQGDAVEPASYRGVEPDGYLKTGDIINRGDTSETPAPMKISDLKFKGYVQVWDNVTGNESLTPWWLLWQTMRLRREDGTAMFTRINPHIPPDHGEDLFCPLNPKAPADQRFIGGGFKACRKQHIPNEDAQLKHVQSKHSRAYAAMERNRVTRERAEDRALQQEMVRSQQAAMEALAGAMGPRVQAATITSTAAVVHAAVAPASEVAKPFTATCADCGSEFHGAKQEYANAGLRGHRRAKHPVSGEAPEPTEG